MTPENLSNIAIEVEEMMSGDSAFLPETDTLSTTTDLYNMKHIGKCANES